MITEDQSEAIAFLASPTTHGCSSVERIDTHTAVVFLAGARAYKLKRAVRFDYVDFSTLEQRHRFCDAEVRLNRRTAPDLYRGVTAVTRDAGGRLVLGGAEPVVEWLVEMERFDQEQLFDRLAARNLLSIDQMVTLATAVADLHRGAMTRRDHGGRTGMAWVVDGNASGFAEFASEGLDPDLSDRVTKASRDVLQREGERLDARRGTGSVRECHGDLHLRNIVLIDGRPTLFDGVEFNDEISCIDVLYDLAFLLMDLWRRGLPRHANAVLNRYMSETEDLEALGLLPFFLACRAAVRAKTSATAAKLQVDTTRRRELREEAGRYLTMADRMLHPSSPSLVAVGGLSGSGKSTVAAALAPAIGSPPGAMVFRSDEIRKRLCGVDPLEHLGPEGYQPDVSERVYDTLVDRARTGIRGGHSAIVDAVYADPARRQELAHVAASLSVPFVGCWLDAADSTLIGRVENRRHDTSDADAAVIRTQRRQDMGPIEWHRLDADRPRDQVVDAAARLVRDELPSQPGPGGGLMRGGGG